MIIRSVTALATALVALVVASHAFAGKKKAADVGAPAAVTTVARQSFAIGATAPATDVLMLGVDGKQSSIASAKGAKGTLVIFTCNHCPYVKAWQDRIVEVGNAAGAKGVGVIAINSNDPNIVAGDSLDAMRELAKAKAFAFPYVVDAGSKVARAFGAGRTPEAFLLDAQGKLVYHGAIDDNAEDAKAVSKRYLADAIDSLVAGTEIAVKETKAIGCSIKFTPSI